ncbi:hypothetical protein BC938DRAFT_474024, partial [Jimgerdemannia flammicorona]
SKANWLTERDQASVVTQTSLSRFTSIRVSIFGGPVVYTCDNSMASALSVVSHQLENGRLNFLCVSSDASNIEWSRAQDVLAVEPESVELYRTLYKTHHAENHVHDVKTKSGSVLLLTFDQLNFVQTQFRSGNADVALEQINSFLSSGRGAPPTLLPRIFATLLSPATPCSARKAHRILHNILVLQGAPAFTKIWRSFASYTWPGRGRRDEEEEQEVMDSDEDEYEGQKDGRRAAPLSRFDDFWSLVEQAMSVPKNAKEAMEWRPILLLFDVLVSILERDFRDKRPGAPNLSYVQTLAYSLIITFVPPDDMGLRTRLERQLDALARVFEGRREIGQDGREREDEGDEDVDPMELENEEIELNVSGAEEARVEGREDLEAEFQERVVMMQRVLNMLILLSFYCNLIHNDEFVRQTYRRLFRNLNPHDTSLFLQTLVSPVFTTSLLDLTLHDLDHSFVPRNLIPYRKKSLTIYKVLHYYTHTRPVRLDPAHIWRHIEILARLARSCVDEYTVRCQGVSGGDVGVGVGVSGASGLSVDADGWEVWPEDEGTLIASGVDEESLKVVRKDGRKAVEELRERVKGWLEEGRTTKGKTMKRRDPAEEEKDRAYEERIEWTLETMALCLEMM